ncbi:hypothetical protein ABPG74_020762 [Tetrahymena malaccensis]
MEKAYLSAKIQLTIILIQFLNINLCLDTLPIQIKSLVYNIPEKSGIVYQASADSLWRYSQYDIYGNLTSTYIIQGFSDLSALGRSYYFIQNDISLFFFTSSTSSEYQIIDLNLLTTNQNGYLTKKQLSNSNFGCSGNRMVVKNGQFFYYICVDGFYCQANSLQELQTSSNTIRFSSGTRIRQGYFMLGNDMLVYKNFTFTQLPSVSPQGYILLDQQYDLFLQDCKLCKAQMNVPKFDCSKTYDFGYSSDTQVVISKVFQSNGASIIFGYDSNQSKYIFFDANNLKIIAYQGDSLQSPQSQLDIIQNENYVYIRQYLYTVIYDSVSQKITITQVSSQLPVYSLVSGPYYNANFYAGSAVFLQDANSKKWILNINQIYQVCQKNCFYCPFQTPDLCQLCNNGYNFNNNKCSKTCPNQDFLLDLNDNCICKSNMDQVDANTCVCKKGYVRDAYNICQKCPDNCNACDQSLKCTLCAANYYLQLDNSCNTTCPSFAIKNQQQMACKCDPNSSIINNQCQCNIKYYQVGNQCLQCIQNCDSCSDQLICSKCSQGFFNLGDGKCNICQTDKGYYLSQNQCNKCIDNCDLCSNSTSCDKCSAGFYKFQDGSCNICDTTKGFYISQSLCIKCIDKCDQCSDSLKCNQCSPGFYKFEDGTCNICDTNHGYFIKQTMCSKCQSNCDQCSDPLTCIKCSSGFYKFEDGTCNTCDTNHGYFISNDKCLPCMDNCLQCSNQSSCNQFSNCGARFKYDKVLKQCVQCLWDLQQLECVNQCQNNQFYDQQKQLCGQCYYNKGECLQNCPIGYYSNQNNECLKCQQECKQCTGPNKNQCKQCNQPYILQENNTCQLCQSGTFFDKNSNQCIQCFQKCLNCYGDQQDNCLECVSGYVLSKNTNECLTESQLQSQNIEIQKLEYSNCSQIGIDGSSLFSFCQLVSKMFLGIFITTILLIAFTFISNQETFLSWYCVQMFQVIGNISLDKNMNIFWLDIGFLKNYSAYNFYNLITLNYFQDDQLILRDFNQFDIGFQVQSLYKNMIQNCFYQLVALLLIFFLMIFCWFMKDQSGILFRLNQYLTLNGLIRYFMVSSNLIFVYSLQIIKQKNFLEQGNIYIMGLFGVVYILLQIFCFYIIKFQMSSNMSDKINVLQLNINQNNCSSRLFWTIFEIRKLTLLVCLINFNNFKYIGFALSSICFLFFTYIILAKPFQNKNHQISIILTEFSFIILFIIYNLISSRNILNINEKMAIYLSLSFMFLTFGVNIYFILFFFWKVYTFLQTCFLNKNRQNLQTQNKLLVLQQFTLPNCSKDLEMVLANFSLNSSLQPKKYSKKRIIKLRN